MSKLCGKTYGSGLGDVRRVCCRPEGHTGRCSDMPFLMHLEQVKPKVADKIVRDTFNTRGASWGKALDGTQKRRNRQPRTPHHELLLHHEKSQRNLTRKATAGRAEISAYRFRYCNLWWSGADNR